MGKEVESTRLAELVKDSHDSLYPGSKKSDASKRSKVAWTGITSSMNTEFPGNNWSVDQIKEKVKYIKKKSKEQFQVEKR